MFDYDERIRTIQYARVLSALIIDIVIHCRCRLSLSDAQLLGLEKRFETQKYLSTPDRIELADTLHLSQLQVKTW